MSEVERNKEKGKTTEKVEGWSETLFEGLGPEHVGVWGTQGTEWNEVMWYKRANMLTMGWTRTWSSQGKPWKSLWYQVVGEASGFSVLYMTISGCEWMRLFLHLFLALPCWYKTVNMTKMLCDVAAVYPTCINVKHFFSQKFSRD